VAARARVEAIFWDNDGILVDTEHLYMRATREVMATRGTDLSEAQYIEWFLRQNRGILHFADVHGWSAAEVAAMRQARNDRYAELLRSEPLLIEGVSDVLSALHGRVRMGIVTSSRREHFDIIHAGSGLLRYVDFVLADGDYAASKPHPAPYLAAIERTGVPPASCLVVEDSERGLRSAIAAGLSCVIVPSRLTARETFPGALRVLSSVRDVIGILDEA
jgi:HAD superfamily hydrolase (TIGR01509 family)